MAIETVFKVQRVNGQCSHVSEIQPYTGFSKGWYNQCRLKKVELYRCRDRATVKVNGKLFCAKHDPS